MKRFKLTSSVKKLPSATVVFEAVRELGLTFTFIFLSFVSFGFVIKNRGIGNLSSIINLASSTGASSRLFKFSWFPSF